MVYSSVPFTKGEGIKDLPTVLVNSGTKGLGTLSKEQAKKIMSEACFCETCKIVVLVSYIFSNISFFREQIGKTTSPPRSILGSRIDQGELVEKLPLE
jgi:hypothetical protein